MRKFATNDQDNYYSWFTSIMVNGNNAYELKGKFLGDLHNNAFSRTHGEDTVEHIEYFLKIVDPIDLLNVNQDKLRVFVFPISLVRDAWRCDDVVPTNEKTFNLKKTNQDDEQEISKIFGTETNFFNYKTPILMKKRSMIGFMNETKMCHGFMKSHGQIMEHGKNPNQLNIIASHLIIKLNVQNGQPIAGGKMDIVMEETCMEPKLLETRFIIKILNVMMVGENGTAMRLPTMIKMKESMRMKMKKNVNCLMIMSCRFALYEDSGYQVFIRTRRRNSSYLSLRKKYRLILKNDMPPRDKSVKYPNGIAENVLVGIGKFVFPVDFIILDMIEDVKVPLILGRPFLSTAQDKIDVCKRKITLRVKDEKIIFKNVKTPSTLIKRVYMLSLRERMELDLEARIMGETLILNISLDPLYGDYIKLNDLNMPLELKRDQVDDLMPTIEEGEVVDKPMIKEVKTRNVNKMIEFSGRNELGNFAYVPVFIGNFYVITDFTVVEDMDPYLDEEIFKIRRIHAHDTAYLENLTHIDTYRFLHTTYLGPRWKEIDNVGEVSIIWNPMCVLVMLGEYDKWAMKMEHYLSHTYYPIWQVIQNGNGYVSVTTDTNGMIKVLPPKTAEDVVARENERKARTTLLMALPEDHLAKFHKMADAKEMWEAIKSRFGGNDDSKAKDNDRRHAYQDDSKALVTIDGEDID
uniref:Ribonuclease H-like domain, reverse transcriptase, RNA-dependent DNA polymerase n=1 Tax=Tanacetum cinerariifolium TaxID=118510 RepID=A0A6L2MFH9_TANCI|nr:ribonuclease H-like domain, reverse transcriptase, RNA-dependent DNA polymerase [Tanacetum cinerariifolium]